jgi:hypothetical protein
VCPANGEDAQARDALGSADEHEATALTQGVAVYDANDLVGTWHVHSLASGPGAPWWEYGRWAINADHRFSGTIHEYQKDPCDISGQFLPAPNGVATFAGAQQDPDVILFPHLHMAANKAAVVGVGTWPTGSRDSLATTQMIVLTRQGQSYQSADLEGTWYVHSFASGPGAPWWQCGRLMMRADGSFDAMLAEYKSNSTGGSGQFQIDPNGIVTAKWPPRKPVRDFNTGHMTSDKNMIVMVDTWTAGAPGTTELRILTRQGTDYRVSDLAGRWYHYSLASGAESPWWYGPMDIRTDGSFDAPFLAWSNGRPGNWSGQFQIDPSGLVAIVGITSDPYDPGFVTMHLSADKNVIIGVRMWAGGAATAELMVWTRMATAE